MTRNLNIAIALLPVLGPLAARPTFAQTHSPARASTVPASTRDASAPAPAWENVTRAAAFSPRDTAEGVVFGDRMWLSNGWHSPNVLTRDLWCSRDGVNWSRISGATPYDGYSEMVVFRNKMWAVRGSTWCSDNGADWKKVADKTPFGARGYGELVVLGDRMWQLGSGPDVWNTADGVHWERVAAKAPYGNRCAAAVAAYQDKLWLLGGRTPGANNPPEKGYKDMTTHNDVWCSADGAVWTRVLEHAPWAPRQWSVAAVYRERLWMIGGHDNVNSRNLGDVWYTADGRAWRRFASGTTFTPRHEVTCYVFDDSLWVVAGNAWPVQNDVWRLRLPSSWRGEP